MGNTSAWFGEYVTSSLENRCAADPIFGVRLDRWLRDDMTELYFGLMVLMKIE